jgi:hypothetical protein
MTLVTPPTITINLYLAILIFLFIFTFGLILGRIFTLLHFSNSDFEEDIESQGQEESNKEDQ